MCFKKTLSICICIAVLTGILLLGLIFRINKVFEDYGKITLKNELYKRVNDSIYKYIKENGALFDGLSEYIYTAEGDLISIEINTAKLIVLQNGLEKEILSSLSAIKATEFGVPLGSLLGGKLLSGRGPEIKVKTVPLSSLNCSTVNSFESVGINHTLHRVELQFTAEFKASAPFAETEFENTFEITLCESIIIGEVPNVYLN